MSDSSIIEMTGPVSSKSVTELRGVGPAFAEKLAKLGIFTVENLLFHLPLRFQDKTHISPIGSLHAGAEALVKGEVLLSQVKYGKRRSLLVRIGDGTGLMTLRFFYFNKNQEQGFARGTEVWCFGEARRGPDGLEMVHPEYRKLEPDELPPLSQELTPVYPLTDQLQQRTLRNLVLQAVDMMRRDVDLLPELLPAEVLNSRKFASLPEALELMHLPRSDQKAESVKARQRLVFEELLAHQVSVRRMRFLMQKHPAPAFRVEGRLAQKFISGLPFELTGAQQRVIQEIRNDISQPVPMLRLVQGDVGSGKTAVAAATGLQAVEAGYQLALMAPTEILSEQHFANFEQWMTPLGLQVAWLSGRQKVAERRQALELIASGQAQVVVGTHALFQDEVQFHKLGLVIIDEQHRFGVHQRLALRDKGKQDGFAPHQLIMTATPIPRTLAMTAYADLDVSIIDELPKGRKPVETVVIPETRRPEVVERVRHASREGRQVYWVCPLIEESELLECQAAEDTAATLAQALGDLKVGLVHGRLKPAEKQEVMSRFKSGELDLLVATTVIEVGVDVPNASLMIIENAERMGLSQLHQLRGRVGRGAVQSSCVLMYRGPLSQSGRRRLAAMRESNDGFYISQVDLELRGPGELLGTRQTGMLQFRIADLERDQELLPAVEQSSDLLLSKYPDNIGPLIQRWLPQGLQYGDV